MALTQHPINLGVTNDDGSGSNLKAGGGFINLDIGNLISAVNNLITLLGAGNETTVDLATFTGTTIADGRTVKQALQDLETFAELANKLDPGYAAAVSATTLPAAGDTVDVAIGKLHSYVTFLTGLKAVTFVGAWDASTGSFPSVGTAPGTNAVQKGNAYRVTVAGVVGGVQFNVNDDIVALVDSPSTSVFAGNWFQGDNTDLVTSVFSRTGAISAQAGDYTATQITNTPAGNVAATNVQAAINELDTEKIDKSFITAKGSLVSGTAVGAPIGVTVGADGTAVMADSTTSSGLSYGVQLESRFDQVNLTANTTLAASTINANNYIAFAQTTSGITVTIPNPTVSATKHRTVTLCNEGTSELGVTFASGTGFFLTPNNVMDITWNGTRWVAANAQLAVSTEYAEVKTGDGAGFAVNSYVDFASVVAGNMTVDTVADSILLRAGRVYHLTAMLRGYGGTGPLEFAFVDATTGTELVANTGRGMLQANSSTEHPFMQAELIYTPSVDQAVKVRGVSGAGTFNYEGRISRVVVRQIAGFAPVLGTTVDYAQAVRVASQAVPANNTVIQFDSVSGNMTVSAGVFTLKAGKTYRLQAGVVSCGGVVNLRPTFSWFNVTAGTSIGAQMGLISPADGAANSEGGGVASATITPTVDTQVDFRIVGGAAAAAVISGGDFNAGQNVAAWAQVTQIGTTAFSGSVTPIVQRFTASGTYTPTVGMKYAVVELQGGGGSGGNAGPANTQHAAGSGGSSGGYRKILLTAAQIGSSVTVTIGAGGTNGAGGGSTSFGALSTVNGGGAGATGLATSNNNVQFSGYGTASGQGTHTTGTIIAASAGDSGLPGLTPQVLGNTCYGGPGASSPLGSGGGPVSASGGTVNGASAAALAFNYGGGGGGAVCSNTASTAIGGAGAPGVVIVTEYFL